MRIPLSWLRDYVRVDADAQQIADALSISTAEVNGIHRVGVRGDLSLFRVGHVLEAAKHPDADRLQLTSVDVGEDRPYSIVCGAWNFGAGAKVAVALPGATLPDGLVLERRKLRGQLSEGMILAEDELDLGTDHSGIIVLDDALEAGTPLADVLPLVDEVLDLEPTGNRPDLLAIYGVAREVAALLGGELLPLPGEDPPRAGDEPVGIRIDDPAGCLRFVGRLLRDVEIGESPPWLKARLRHAGVRAISNVVDVTNYVMLALGSPLHAYDLDLLHGGLVARRAHQGEKLRTLDGVERTLTADDLVIADDERAVGLAGIMGGEETEVSSSTKNVLLEAANFEPVGILRSSERHSLRTEGSNRWEKGVDPYVAGQAATYATQLIVELSGARWTGAEDVQGALPEPAVIPLRPERANALIGLEVAEDEQTGILERLGFERLEGGFRVPTWRARDVTREVDLIEEVARFKLPEIPFTLPRREAMFGRLTREQRLRRQVEDVLVGAGYAEVYTPTLRRRRRLAAARAAVRRGGRAPHRPLRVAPRPCAPQRGRRAARTSRCSRSRASTATSEPSCPTSGGTSPGSPTAASPRRSGRSSRSTPRSAPSPFTSARPPRTFTRGRRRRRPRAGSASSTRRCSTASGAPSSSTSTRWLRRRRRPRPSRR